MFIPPTATANIAGCPTYGLHAPAGGPDTSQEYIRRVLFKPQPSGATDVGLLVCTNAPVGALGQPLGAKLPVHGMMGQAALNSSSELREYVVAQPLDGLAASAHQLSLITTAALNGLFDYQPGGSEGMTAMKMSLLVDAPLSFAAASLDLDWRMDRNTADQSGVTGAWVGGQVSSCGTKSTTMRCFTC